MQGKQHKHGHVMISSNAYPRLAANITHATLPHLTVHIPSHQASIYLLPQLPELPATADAVITFWLKSAAAVAKHHMTWSSI